MERKLAVAEHLKHRKWKKDSMLLATKAKIAPWGCCLSTKETSQGLCIRCLSILSIRHSGASGTNSSVCHLTAHGCCWVSYSRPTLCGPMDCSMPGLPVPHHLPELAQVLGPCLSDAIQPSYPLTLSSPSAFNLSQLHGLPMSHLFTSDDQNTGTSASASVLPVNIQDWSLLRLTVLISLLSKWLSGIFFSTRVRRHQFFGILPSLWASSHNRTWTLGRP